jgi:hypothetical protein
MPKALGVAEELMVLTSVLEVPASNLGPDVEYRDRPSEYRVSTLKQAVTGGSLQILCNSLSYHWTLCSPGK